jgi:GT2 family glycosyltransferase
MSLEDIIALPRVAIVILNWNGREDTLACLGSLKQLTGVRYDIVVVDNASVDGSVEAIKSEYPEVEVLVNSENLGFAEGNNVGIRWALAASADYVFILNNDTIVASDLLRVLVASAEEDPRIGVVGPKICYDDSSSYHPETASMAAEGPPARLWYAGAEEQWLRRIPASVGLDELDRGQYDQKRETAFVYGTAMLVRRQVLESVGMFDRRFFAYHEDADLCLRVREAGYRCLYEPSGVVWHKVSRATQGTSYIQDYLRARGRILFFFKHLQGGRLYLVLGYELYRWFKVCFPYLWESRWRNLVAYSKGLWDGLCEFGFQAARFQRYSVRVRLNKLQETYGSD